MTPRLPYARPGRWRGSWWKGNRRYELSDCGSGYNEAGAFCIPHYDDLDCPDGHTGDGYTCSRGKIIKSVQQGTPLPCSDGSIRHESIQACFGSCPAGTTLCGAENGLLCLDDDQTCVEYSIDLGVYIAQWIAAGASGNVIQILGLIGGIDAHAHEVCDSWNDDV